MLTQAELKELVLYDPTTGMFTRLRAASRSPAGTVLGTPNSEGYLRVGIASKRYKAHRLAFLYMTGEWPNVVDHINGVRTDNRWANLRDANHTVNAENKLLVPLGNNPFLGVSWSKRRSKWHAQIMVGGKQHNLGFFCTPEEASSAYIEAKRRMHAGCTA